MFAGIDLSPGNSALVLGDQGTKPSYFTHSEENVKADYFAREGMAIAIYLKLRSEALKIAGNSRVKLIALEDYDQNPRQQVGYQIAETAAILKYKLLGDGYVIMLVNPSKVKGMVADHRFKGKMPVIEWAEAHGFPLPAKSPGKPGLYKRQREDIADAFVLWNTAHIAHNLLTTDLPADLTDVVYPLSDRQLKIFTDPKKGLVKQPGLILNREKIK